MWVGGGEGRLSFSFCWSFSPVFLEEERKDDPQVKCARKVLFSLRRACLRKVTKKLIFDTLNINFTIKKTVSVKPSVHNSQSRNK